MASPENVLLFYQGCLVSVSMVFSVSVILNSLSRQPPRVFVLQSYSRHYRLVQVLLLFNVNKEELFFLMELRSHNA